SGCTLHACLASPAGRKKIAHRFIGGCGSGVGQVPEGRKNSTVPGGTRCAPRSVPTDKSVGYSRSPRWAGSDACKVQGSGPLAAGWLGSSQPQVLQNPRGGVGLV